jgi:hypothetical protein
MRQRDEIGVSLAPAQKRNTLLFRLLLSVDLYHFSKRWATRMTRLILVLTLRTVVSLLEHFVVQQRVPRFLWEYIVKQQWPRITLMEKWSKGIAGTHCCIDLGWKCCCGLHYMALKHLWNISVAQSIHFSSLSIFLWPYFIYLKMKFSLKHY